MNYKEMIDQAPVKEAALGSQRIALLSYEKLDGFQVGYSVDPNGRDLTGKEDGDWKKEWTVVGHDTLLGDPFFVDTVNSECPVFTAMHGAGIWVPNAVSPSLEAFIQSLSVIHDFETTMERTKLDQEIEFYQKKLAEINGPSHTEYWEGLFQMLLEEIEENE